MRDNSSKQLVALSILLLIGLSLRILNYPSRYQIRDSDELGYTYGGILLWEGITPGYKMSPAGFQTWVSWTYCGCQSLMNLIRDPNSNRLPAFIRPLSAVDKTLFDVYRDTSTLKQLTVALITLISLGAIYAAFHIGCRSAGIPGGLLSGGLAALLPLYVRASGMATPYMPAWAYAIISSYFAATKSRSMRWAGSAVFMGLAISSRIEMLLFLPVVLWLMWKDREPEPFGHIAIRFASLTFAVTLLVSPWLLTNLLGNIRTIATVRFAGASIRDLLVPLFKDFALFQGLGPAAILLLAGLAFSSADKRRAHGWLLFIVIVLMLTMLKPTPYGLRHHGATVAAIVVLCPLALARFQERHARAALILSILLLIIPAANATSSIMSDRYSYVPDQATAWVEKNVPPGTAIYLCPTLNDPLPTTQSADSLWTAVTDSQAWQVKFRQGLIRFNISQDRIPRALSEENLVQERGNRRRWFILGGGQEIKAPRFDIKIISGGSPFDVTPNNAISEYQQSGGVLILRQSREPEFLHPGKELGTPNAAWINEQGQGTFVYYKPSKDTQILSKENSSPMLGN
jgi:hypothetical protein